MQPIQANIYFLLNFVGWRECNLGYSKCQTQFFAHNFVWDRRKNPSTHYPKQHNAANGRASLNSRNSIAVSKSETEMWLCLWPGCSVLPVNNTDRRSAFLPLSSGTQRWVIVYHLLRSAALTGLPDKTFPFTHTLCISKPDTLPLNRPILRPKVQLFCCPCHHEIKAIHERTYATWLWLNQNPTKHLWTVLGKHLHSIQGSCV